LYQLIPVVTPLIDGFVFLADVISKNMDVIKPIVYIVGGALVGVFVVLTAKMVAVGVAAVAVSKTLLAVGVVIGAVIGAIIALFEDLGTLLYETPFNPPNFLQGLFDIANGFTMIAQSALMILNPFNLVASAIKKIGGVFSDILGGVTSFFTAITDPSAAENVKKIAAAISEVSIPNAGAFTAAMTATAGATATRGALGGTQTGGVQNGDKPYEVTINVMLDRDKLASVVQEINGEAAREAIAQRG